MLKFNQNLLQVLMKELPLVSIIIFLIAIHAFAITQSSDMVSSIEIKGTIIDVSNLKPILGVKIQINDSINCTYTDKNGNFITKVPNYNCSLMILHKNYVGIKLPMSTIKQLYIDSNKKITIGLLRI